MQTFELMTPPVTAPGDCDVNMADVDSNEVLEESALGMSLSVCS